MSTKKLTTFVGLIRNSVGNTTPFTKYNFHRLWIENQMKGFEVPKDFIPKDNPSLAVILYGSSVAGTSLDDGDADFAMTFFSCDTSGEYTIMDVDRNNQEKLLSTVFHHIIREQKIKSQRIFRARVPVIQFQSNVPPYDGFKFDLCLSTNGVRNSLLLRKYMESDSRLHLGCLLAKAWGKQSNILNSRRGWISSYALSIMYIYYFQMVLQKDYLVDDSKQLTRIVSACHKGKYEEISELNTPVTVGPFDPAEIESDISGFFQFYSKGFDFDSNVVDVRAEGRITKKDHWIECVTNLSLKERWNLLGHENLFIRDPFEPHNLGRSVDFLKSEHIREEFRLASQQKDALFFLYDS